MIDRDNTGGEKSGFDERAFRNTVGRFASGVTVVTTLNGSVPHGMTVSAFVSVSLDPPLILVSINKQAAMHNLLPNTRMYGVSILAAGQEEASEYFAGHPVGGYEPEFTSRIGMPLISEAAGYLVADLVGVHPAGDHTLYLGEVSHVEWNDARPLVYYAGRYRRLRGRLFEQPSAPEDEIPFF